jgi:hypothetical protein
MNFWVFVFGLAAIFNLAVGLPMLLAPEVFFSLTGQPAPADLLFVRMSGGLIAVFGVGYAMVARNPMAHRGIAFIGVIGKIIAPAILWFYYQAGAISFSNFAMGLGDLAFAALFAAFLLTTANGARANGQ